MHVLECEEGEGDWHSDTCHQLKVTVSATVSIPAQESGADDTYADAQFPPPKELKGAKARRWAGMIGYHRCPEEGDWAD
jgi:hypothetical protein